MRVLGDRELVVVDEELETLQPLAPELPRAQHLNVAATELRTLNVTHNALASLCEVAALAHLRVLKCSYNNIADLRWLAGLSALQELWATHNRIESAQIAHLQALTQLGTLVLHPNPCTESPSYLTDAVRALPWLERIDTVVVDQTLRDKAQHASERDVLSTGSTDCSLYLLSGRSDDGEGSTPPTPASSPPAVLPSPPPVIVRPEKQLPLRKSKREIAEEFMRNFPVQDYIPVQDAKQQQQQDDASTMPISQETAESLETNEPLSRMHMEQGAVALPTLGEYEEGSFKADSSPEEEMSATEGESGAPPPPPPLSSIASAVLSLPTFSSDGFLKRHAPKSKTLPTTTNASWKKSSTVKGKGNGAAFPSPKLPTAADVNVFKQDEWLLTYPNTTVTAVHIRPDGSAVAKWPNGSIAVSVDRERDGFRIYAAHKDGQIALSFDSAGVGFVNYYPSGKMMISTTSSGDGLYFSSDGFSILRQWDAHLNIKDEHSDPADSLGNETDGSVLCKLSDGIGIRIQLADSPDEATELSTTAADLLSKANTVNPIQLTVYFATTSGIRYKFVNGINQAPARTATTTSGLQNDACDCVFGKQQMPESKREEHKPPPIPHADLLHDIRAAVASLQL